MRGVVFYQDDPQKRTFRFVIPSYDGELDDPACILEQTTVGLDPARVAVMEQVADDDPRVAFAATPFTPVGE